MKKVQFGCGQNKLKGWENYDMDVDIREPLPFEDNSIDFIYAEHVIEHVEIEHAVNFFIECKRVLKDGGVARYIVPSIVEQFKHRDEKRFNKYTKYFAKKKWSNNTPLGVMKSILYGHGHKTAWTRELMEVVLTTVGFNDIKHADIYTSEMEELSNIAGHWKKVGRDFFEIDSICLEVTK
jgi:ubiquinone/menaquinone biosynthesis C-methylase UbiE